MTDIRIRLAVREDVPRLLALLPQITSRSGSPSGRVTDLDAAYRTFDRILEHGNVHSIVAEQRDRLVAALTLVVVPNFTYEGRPWSIVENVVVDRDCRGQGIGKRLMAFAFDFAREQGCYKTQLLSGTRDDQVGFYRSCGFEDAHTHGFKKHFIDRET